MKQNEHEKLTIRVNGKCVEVEDMNGITATAKCNPVDKFNIHVGIGIALERLKEAQEKAQFKPYVCGDCSCPHYKNSFYGYIGDETDLKDEFDRVLRVGDTVQIKAKNDPNIYISTIIKTPVYDGAMGFPHDENNRPNIDGFKREQLVIVKLPRQKKTQWCTLIETYDEMKGK